MVFQDVREAVIAALQACSNISSGEIPDNCQPIEHLGFDSMDGIAVACELSARLRIVIPDDQNPLVDDERHRGRTIKEIVTLIQRCEQAKDNE